MPASPKFKTIITDYGKQRLIAAMSPGGTKLTLTQMAVGDGGGNPTNPDTTSAALVNEVWRAAVNSVSVDKTHSNIIIVELLIPAEVGGFWIREAGIYDEFNKLVAVCSLPASEKPLLEQGSGRAQTVRMTLIISDMSTINITIDSTTIIATNDYVDNSLKEHEKSRNHPDATLTDKGFTKLYSGVTSIDETMAATPKAVKIAMDNASARLAKERNLADLTNIPLARQSLQLGNSATLNVGTTPRTVAAGDDSRITGALQKDQNGADIPDKPGFIKNVGLTEAVNQAAGAMQKSANGGDIQNVVAFRNALQLGTAALASMGVGKNQVLSASDFSFFAGGNGYLYIPCLATTGNPVKIMLQWGIIQTRGGENNIYNLPYAFPTTGLWAMGCRAANGYSQSMNVSIENRSQIRIQNWAPAGAVEDCCFFAVGYL